MIQVPEAPPPPLHHSGMDTGIHHLGVDMDRLNFGLGAPQHNAHNGPHVPSFDANFPGHIPHFDTSLPLDGNGKVPVTYEGCIFTKEVALRPDQKETWAKVVKTPMVASQADLREIVTKQKKKGKSVASQLSSVEMKGYKRQQIDRLIADSDRADPDPRFEHKLAALKLEQGRNSKGRETLEMKAILKRQLRPGYAQPSASARGPTQAVEGEIVDLTGAEETNYSQDSYSTGTSGRYPHSPPQGYAQPWVNHAAPPHLHDTRYVPQPTYGHAGHPGHPGHPVVEQVVPASGGQHMAPEGHESPKKEEKKHDKKDKKEDKEKVKIHQEKDKKHKTYSDSSSEAFSDADSFESKAYTDRTPDTVYSGKSDHRYYEDKKRSSGHKDSRHHSHSSHRDRSPVRPVYRERRRKSPARPSRKGSTRYDYEDFDVITSERPRERDRVYDTSRRNSRSYSYERPLHPRALSFDDDRHHRPSYALPRRLQSYAYATELHAEKEELKLEIEEMRRQKQFEKMEQERAERERLELRHLEMERAERAERADRDRLDRLHRGRYHRDRYERSQYAEPPRRLSTYDYYGRDRPYHM
ncbi:MAG: hypothetical protein Q9191_004582 [Dirinaria sp. TL-2023a]